MINKKGHSYDAAYHANVESTNNQYGDTEILKNYLLYKSIIKWDENKLTLDDGTICTLECSEQDMSAYAEGSFSEVELNAIITNVEIDDPVDISDDTTTINEVKITIYHNRNIIAKAQMIANAGDFAYYYAVGSFVVNNIHFAIVEAY